MSLIPTSAQMLFMLRLVFGPSEPTLADTRPELDGEMRKKLESHGLIRLEKRGRSQHVILTEHGWEWVEQHLDCPISPAGGTPSLVLSALLPKLKAFLDAKGATLGELLLGPQAAVEPAAAEAPHAAASDTDIARLMSVLQRLDGGKHRFVSLADLRNALPDVPRRSFDAAALSLQAQGRIALFRIDEPWRRSPRVEAAAIDVAGSRYHSAYLKG
jgi:hypothetical protein